MTRRIVGKLGDASRGFFRRVATAGLAELNVQQGPLPQSLNPKQTDRLPPDCADLVEDGTQAYYGAFAVPTN